MGAPHLICQSTSFTHQQSPSLIGIDLDIRRIGTIFAQRQTMPTASSSRGISAPAFPGIAYPLPKKKPGWEPLHLTFRHAALPRLPSIHSRAILAVMKCGAYEKPIPPSNHSIKTLAWMGDAVLYLAATKATLKAAVGGKNGQHLTVSNHHLYTRFSRMGLDSRLMRDRTCRRSDRV